MKEYYIVYGWIDEYNDDSSRWQYDGYSQYMHPVPWAITEDKNTAVHYFNCNTDESLQLVIIHTKLNEKCFDLNKITERLEWYANRWEGNSFSWTDEQWEALTTNYNGKDPEIFELNLDN